MNGYLELLHRTYDANEARAVFYRLMEDKYGLSRTDVVLGGISSLTDEQKADLESDIQRLAQGEPVQYVTGMEYFHGLRFEVASGVLIPRPETAELVDWIISCKDAIRGDRSGHRYILDIGCGSGAIAVSLAKSLPESEVSAWDISDTALSLTRRNARSNGASVDIYMQDALSPPDSDRDLWDVIVSNPPYVCQKEAETMDANVLEHEPHIALFVPDDNPLIFYRAIAEYASHALRRSGMLFFEINERFGKETVDMLKEMGFEAVELRQDQFGKDRMVRASLLNGILCAT